MNVSHASVHPVEDLPTTDGGVGIGGGNNNNNNNNEVPRVRMKDIQGMPGTAGGLALRICQFVSAVMGLCIMATTSDFPSVTAFCYLVAATGLQSVWSISQAIIDIYALLVRRSLQNYRVVSLFAIGDGITSTLTFAAACASAGITVLIDNDLNSCAHNHCSQFETATAMAFISWFTTLPSFLLNFWSLASR
ncbi:CASP-like protein 5A2 [Gossypium australe]|uniref:CASP-like protein n=1 Tax=Gossypium australe TaxID=47621 RepID=A0A5B6X9E8_9ROSI|nr:CASP-like protein 5A2 [Gossypium australe]